MRADQLSVYGEPEDGLGHHKAVLVHEIDNPSGTADAWWAYQERLYLVSLTASDKTTFRFSEDNIQVTVASPLSMPVLKRVLDGIEQVFQETARILDENRKP